MKRLAAITALGLAGAGVAQLGPASIPLTEPPAPLPPTLVGNVKGLVPIGRVSCIRFIDAVDARSAGTTVLWKTGPKLAYRNDTTGGCFGLRRNDRIVTSSIKGRLCKGDFVRTADRTTGVPTGSCALGEFIRYAPPGTR